MEDQETPYGQVALKFSTDLLNRQFEEAHSLLGTPICSDWTPSLLQKTYEEMIEYFEIPPNEVSVDVVDESLATKADSAWVYVSIIGEGNAEAVTIIVSNEQGRYLIQELEWGRP